ncbi:MAG TPA: hypothetical protein DIS75_04025 [Chryseobacterium sp.]|nr:hypothetical protein [Chryseobacterium sp.]
MKISVIIPVYNVERYLKQCLESVITQTFRNLEIILVNDGSTDGSAQICNKFAKKDQRIKVIHQINGGVSSARNRGIKIANGDYITFVDSDDWLTSDMYENMVSIIVSANLPEVVMCDFLNVKNNVSEKVNANIRNGFYNKENIINELYPTLLVTENFGRIPIVSACICLFEKSLLVQNNIYFDEQLRYSEDYLFMAAVLINVQSFYYMKEHYYYNYLQVEDSRSKKYKPEWWENLLSLNKKLRKLLSDNKEYDFERQLKLQLIHSALFVSSSIYRDQNILKSQKLTLFKALFDDKNLRESFIDIRFKKQSLSQKVVLLLMKKRMPQSYLNYLHYIAKLKK